MNTDVKAIATAITADEKPPLKPYKVRKNTPPKFPYEEYTLMPPEDARKIIKTLEALNARAATLTKMESKYTEMRTQVTQKIQELKGVEGYSDIEQDMSSIRDRLATEVEQTMDRAGDVLLEYNDVVTTIFEQTATKKVTPTAQNMALVEAIKKFASPTVAGKIMDDVDKTVAAAEEASTKITRELASWPAPQDLRKKIKEEKPDGIEAAKTADIMGKIKGFFTSFIDTLKSAWTTVSDAVSSLANSTNAAVPLLNEIKSLAESAGFTNVQGSKKVAMVDAGTIRMALLQDESLYNQVIGMMSALVEGGDIDESLRENLGTEIKKLVREQFNTPLTDYFFRTQFVDIEYGEIADYFIQSYGE